MRALVQRVREASVTVDGRITGAIDEGLLVLAGVGDSDAAEDRDWQVRQADQALRIYFVNFLKRETADGLAGDASSGSGRQ